MDKNNRKTRSICNKKQFQSNGIKQVNEHDLNKESLTKSKNRRFVSN